MEIKAQGSEKFSLKALKYLELLVASLLPVTIILLVGVLGTRFIVPAYAGFFVLIFFFAAILAFFAEFALITTIQKATREQFSDIIAVCQAHLAGDKARRAVVRGEQDLTTTLAKTLNALLDSVAQQMAQPTPQLTPPQPTPPQPTPAAPTWSMPQPTPAAPTWSMPQPTPTAPTWSMPLTEPQPTAQTSVQKSQAVQNETSLKRQLKQLVQEINPVMEADLSVKATIVAGDVGIVADICNYLIEELVQNVQWVRFASEQIITATREMLNRSIELAQTIETQMAQLLQVTETAEELVAFIQHLNNTLQLNVDIAQEMYIHVQEQMGHSEHDSSYMSNLADSVSQKMMLMEQNAQRQQDLLNVALQGTQRHATTAESMISSLYAFAQGIHQSSTDVLNTAENISSLVALAEQWRNSVEAFHLSGEEFDGSQDLEEEEEEEADNSIMFSIPTSASSMKGIQKHN